MLVTVNKLTVSFIHLFNLEWPIVHARHQNDELPLSERLENRFEHKLEIVFFIIC